MKKILYCLIGVLIAFSSCETIEDRDEMGAKLNADQLQLNVYNTTPGGNQIVVVNNTPKVAGLWNLLVDKSTRKQDTVLLPFLGKQTISFTATTDGGLVTATREVEISTIDHPLAPEWSFIAGSGTSGKTWVWALDYPGGSAYGNGGYLGNNEPSWWKPSTNDLTNWGVVNDKMTFDLNGGPNFTLVTGNTTADGLPAGTYKGSFKFDMSKTKMTGDNKVWAIGNLTLTGTTLSRGFQPNVAGKPAIYSFDILKLSENEMILACPEPNVGAWGTAWFWVLKKQGYSYVN